MSSLNRLFTIHTDVIKTVSIDNFFVGMDISKKFYSREWRNKQMILAHLMEKAVQDEEYQKQLFEEFNS